MSELAKIKYVDPETARWLAGMNTKYSLDDIRAGNGTPLEMDMIAWSNEVSHDVKANVRKTKSQATKALLQSVVALPLFTRNNSLITQIQAEEYIDFLQRGVSGTKVKRNSPYKFRNNFVGKKMLASFQVYIAAKPIRLMSKKGQTKKELNKQVAFAIAKSVKMKGIKARNIYGGLVKPDSPRLEELKRIIAKNVGGAIAAQIVGQFNKL